MGKPPTPGVIVTTPEALRELIGDAVREALDAMPKAAPPMMTPAQVAKRLAVCSKTVVSMIKRGDLAAKRVGNMWRVRLDDLEAWERGQ